MPLPELQIYSVSTSYNLRIIVIVIIVVFCCKFFSWRNCFSLTKFNDDRYHPDHRWRSVPLVDSWRLCYCSGLVLGVSWWACCMECFWISSDVYFGRRLWVIIIIIIYKIYNAPFPCKYDQKRVTTRKC